MEYQIFENKIHMFITLSIFIFSLNYNAIVCAVIFPIIVCFPLNINRFIVSFAAMFHSLSVLAMKKIIPFLLILTLISLGKSSLKAQAPAQCQDVMLQAFYWDSYADTKWTNLNSKVGEISSNFSLVWLPPSGNCQSSTSMGYAPVYWFDQNSAFGTQAELKTLITNLKANGTKTIADVVVNHRSGVSNWTNFPTETYNSVTYSMGPAQICSTDEVKNAAGQATPTGAPDTGDDFNGSRDLDHTSTIVRDNIKGYLQFLKNEMGYSGWRYDMTKGFSASYVNEYNISSANYFSVGEYFDGMYDLCKAWVNNCSNNSTTFDFPLKFVLNAAMWNGGMDLTKLIWLADGTIPQPAGLIHHSTTKRYAVTFVDNHDTYRDNKFNGNVLAAYAFLMSSPGVPCVFLAHWNANKAAISAMIYARRAVQLHSESAITVNQSAANIYVATATGKNGTLIVKIGSGNYTAPSDYSLVTSGTDYAIWTKTTTNVPPPISVSPAGGTYYSTQSVTLSTIAGASIYYTTDNTPATKNSTLYTGALTISSSKILRAIAYNPTTQLYSTEATNSFIISTLPASIKVRFKAPSGWTTCKVYSWSGSTPLAGVWSGTTMTLDPDGYYSYTLAGFTTVPIGVLFNNGAATPVQTVDLSASSDMCWDAATLVNGKYTATEVTCLATGIEDPAKKGLAIYPNPSHGQLTIETKQKCQVAIYNLQGKLLLQKNLENSSENIDLSAFGKGIYMLRLDGKEGRSFRKVVVE
jgi:alpha-amylase